MSRSRRSSSRHSPPSRSRRMPRVPKRRRTRAELLADEIDVPAVAREGVGGERAREAGADDDGAALAWGRRRLRLGDETPAQHLALAADAFALLHLEAGIAQRRAHAAR